MAVVDTRAAAKYVGLAAQTLNKLRCSGGSPPYYKHSRKVVYKTSDLDAWLLERRRVQAPKAQSRGRSGAQAA